MVRMMGHLLAFLALGGPRLWITLRTWLRKPLPPGPLAVGGVTKTQRFPAMLPLRGLFVRNKMLRRSPVHGRMGLSAMVAMVAMLRFGPS